MSDCCADFNPGMEAINGPIVLQSIRSGGKYQYPFKPIVFCPWCGKKINRETAESTISSPVKPISPKEAKAKYTVPDFVIEAVNDLIVKKIGDGKSCTLMQNEVIYAIQQKAEIALGETIARRQVFDKKWLDFEPLFRRNGWSVEYDRPGYNETYEASYKFEAK